MKNNKGFTLIELLVVISIIGLLSSVVLASLNSARGKGRDSKRISDLKQLQVALELYRTDNGLYPGSGHFNSIGSCVFNTSAPVWTTTNIFDSNFTNKYMSQLPVEPTSGQCFSYIPFNPGAGGTGWQCKALDGTNFDPDGTIGNALEVTSTRYGYLITFRAENSQLKLPILKDDTSRYCLLGPAY